MKFKTGLITVILLTLLPVVVFARVLYEADAGGMLVKVTTTADPSIFNWYFGGFKCIARVISFYEIKTYEPSSGRLIFKYTLTAEDEVEAWRPDRGLLNILLKGLFYTVCFK